MPDALRASYNPLAQFDPESPTVVEEASLLAEGLVLPGGDGEDHWTDTARTLVRGVILHLVSTYERDVQDVDPDAVYEPLLPPEDLMPGDVRSPAAFLFCRMECNPAFDGIVSRPPKASWSPVRTSAGASILEWPDPEGITLIPGDDLRTPRRKSPAAAGEAREKGRAACGSALRERELISEPSQALGFLWPRTHQCP